MGMNHPKIPPNCPYFDKQDGYPTTFDWPDTFHWEVGADIGLENRLVIAAVARCAWVDEYKHRMEIQEKIDVECLDNAEQWSKWGKGEPWE